GSLSKFIFLEKSEVASLHKTSNTKIFQNYTTSQFCISASASVLNTSVIFVQGNFDLDSTSKPHRNHVPELFNPAERSTTAMSKCPIFSAAMHMIPYDSLDKENS
ncbi:C-myc promoter-binding protein, partial [Galemys pyrenaicus]